MASQARDKSEDIVACQVIVALANVAFPEVVRLFNVASQVEVTSTVVTA